MCVDFFGLCSIQGFKTPNKAIFTEDKYEIYTYTYKHFCFVLSQPTLQQSSGNEFALLHPSSLEWWVSKASHFSFLNGGSLPDKGVCDCAWI